MLWFLLTCEVLWQSFSHNAVSEKMIWASWVLCMKCCCCVNHRLRLHYTIFLVLFFAVILSRLTVSLKMKSNLRINWRSITHLVMLSGGTQCDIIIASLSFFKLLFLWLCLVGSLFWVSYVLFAEFAFLLSKCFILCVSRSVCRKQELVQLDLEKAEENLASKISQREQLVSLRLLLNMATHPWRWWW